MKRLFFSSPLLLAVLALRLSADAGTLLDSRIIERGQDHAVIQVITATTIDRATRYKTNQFTLLENAIHYFEEGEWRESQNLIEPFPDGAIARHGPNKAIFSSDLNDEAVFDILASDGNRVRGGVRAVQLTDLSTGQSRLLGTVKDSVKAQLLPPDQILYRDAFDGIQADVLLVWRYHSFSHDVVLLEQPAIPDGWDADRVRLEVITEFIVDQEPELRRQMTSREGDWPLEDHAVIHFGHMAMIMGTAFDIPEGAAFSLGGFHPERGGVSVLKQWHLTEDGRAYLIESVGMSEVLPMMNHLPRMAEARIASLAPHPDLDPMAQTRIWPARPARLTQQEPLVVAAIPYEPRGFVVDFHVIPDQGQPSVLELGKTYYIRTSYYSGSSVTFQPGCTIKYKDNAYMLLYGPVSFPHTLQTPVFTSRNDDGFGERIEGVPNEQDSDGNPALHRASRAVWIYYVNFPTQIRNARFRWAKRGIEYNTNPGVNVTHQVSDSLFEYSDRGIFLDGYSHVSLSGLQKWQVNCPVLFYVPVAPFGTDRSFAGMDEVEIGVNPPDTMGAAGASHYVELFNGNLAIHHKTTGAREPHTLRDLFNHPTGEFYDPRILYDQQSLRWVLCALNKNTRLLHLAVSIGQSPTPLSTSWRTYILDVRTNGWWTDYPTLGIDANGVYMSILNYTQGPPSTFHGHMVVALRKSELYNDVLNPTMLFQPISGLDTRAIMPTLNFDATPQGGFAWFIAKGSPEGQGITYKGGAIHYRRMKWNDSGGSYYATWQDPAWQTLSDSGGYRSYFDFASQPFNPPQLVNGQSGTAGFALTEYMSIPQMAVIRGANLWTCQAVGLDGASGAYGGGTINRSAVQWIRAQTKTSGTPLQYHSHGRLFDTAASNPYWYYIPSLTINNSNDVLIGFSGSRGTEYIGAFFSGRKSNGSFSKPVLIQSGRGTYPAFKTRWGDYSYTSLDPDGQTFWTIQSYVFYAHGEPIPGHWGAWITSVKPSP